MRAYEFIPEHQLVWQKKPGTQNISMRWRCTSGPRINRTVPNVADCSAPYDVSKAQRLKTTRRRTASPQARRTALTKARRPMSKLAARLNKVYRSARPKRPARPRVYKWKKPSYRSKKTVKTAKRR